MYLYDYSCSVPVASCVHTPEQLSLLLLNVFVVENLPVPLHISLARLELDNVPAATMTPLRAVCGSPGLDGLVLDRALFPSTYHKHPYWSQPRSDANASAADAGGQQHVDACGSSAAAPPAAVDGFEASMAFCGAKPGHVFKRGEHGLGYYRDLKPMPSPEVVCVAGPSAWLPIAMGAAVVVVAVAAALLVRRLGST